MYDPHSCAKMLLLEPLIRRHWNLEKFLGGPVGQKNAHTTTVQKIDEAIRSQKFWSCARIVQEVGFQAEIVGRWSEGCSCHEKHHELFNFAKHMGRGRGINIPPPPMCERKGVRAAELATGAAIKMCADSFLACSRNILEFVHGLDPKTQHDLKADWEVARAKIMTEMTLKLAQWSYLPNLLCGLAHHDPCAVQACAQRALQLWEQQSASCFHAQSRRFLDPQWSGLDNDETPLRPIVPW